MGELELDTSQEHRARPCPLAQAKDPRVPLRDVSALVVASLDTHCTQSRCAVVESRRKRNPDPRPTERTRILTTTIPRYSTGNADRRAISSIILLTLGCWRLRYRIVSDGTGP